MIPLHLRLSGFLSYRDPIELDFTQFDLACIAGANGAGKSSLLDAITWALFGKARKQDDSLINAQSKAAEVSLIFSYEGNIYRIQRTKVRDKTGVLEFQILQRSDSDNHQSPVVIHLPNGTWKALTEHSLTETNLRIQQTLRLDYDTFINASFFLQGKADQFTQQGPRDRKRILGSILGLEIWEGYRQKASDRRRAVEDEIAGIDGQLREINTELTEEDLRKSRLKALESELKRLVNERAVQEALLENIRKVTATLDEQQKWVESLRRNLEASDRQLNDQEQRLAARQAERDSYAGLIARTTQIEQAFQDWQARRSELERLDQVANRFREQEKRRDGPREEIKAALARLEQELHMLEAQEGELQRQEPERMELLAQAEAANQKQADLEQKLAQRKQLELDLPALRDTWMEYKSAIQSLEKEVTEIKERCEQLEQVEEAVCPLCGQPLSAIDRLALIESLAVEEQQASALISENQARMKQVGQQGEELRRQVESLSGVEAALTRQSQEIARLGSKLEFLETQQQNWQKGGALRLQEVSQTLEQENYAQEARARLAQVDDELRQIGYDPDQHEQARQAELVQRAAENEMRTLEKARAALAPLEREIKELENQIKVLNVEVGRQRAEFDQAAASLAAAQVQSPDQEAAELALLQAQEKENHLRREVGAAHQLVTVLADLKARRKAFEAQREKLARQVGLYKQLERAFGKDGVPALLIEQALPQIEAKSNEILDRLSGGNMSVRFITQAAYKEKARQDLKETLEIQISDSAGTRDYEMFSGGEAFRVNFAIRLALSEVLAQRAGARLQTLVIDEGFGSQDALGRQRLIEAINLVRADFAKILVITHIDELKDAFPSRIEVEKTDRGSAVRVI
jgi:DNA repair protein SbcC/Rad50